MTVALPDLPGVRHAGHLLPDEQPQLVADRARSWFA